MVSVLWWWWWFCGVSADGGGVVSVLWWWWFFGVSADGGGGGVVSVLWWLWFCGVYAHGGGGIVMLVALVRRGLICVCFSPLFYWTFWSLSMYDLRVPSGAYEKQIQQMYLQIQQTEDSKEMVSLYLETTFFKYLCLC